MIKCLENMNLLKFFLTNEGINQLVSVCEVGRSGREDLKRKPPPSPAVM